MNIYKLAINQSISGLNSNGEKCIIQPCISKISVH